MSKKTPTATKSKSTKGVGANLGALPEWNLADLYTSPEAPEVERDLAKAAKSAKSLRKTYQGKLGVKGADGEMLADAVSAYESLSDLMGRLGNYAFLLYAGNQTDPARAKFQGDMGAKLTEISSDLIFFELELNQISDSDLKAALKSPRLKRYKPWLDDLRREKPYQLDEKLETLFHEKSQTSGGAFGRLFSETLAEMRFDVEGEKEALSLEPALTLMTSNEEKKRRAAAAGLAKGFKANVRLFTFITNTLAKDKEISDRWRGFKDVTDSRHLANRVEAPVVDALEAAVRAGYPRLSHRYYALKAKWMGKTKLAYYDRNAPLPDQPERIVSWPEARAMVLDAYAGFSPRMAEIAARFFDERWIDAESRPGKASGAFAAPTVPSAHPYVLLNYLGKSRDVMTLAHELGHGVHQVLANGQGPLLAPTPLTLAETASVFGEMLTFKALLKSAPPKERKALLAGKVEDMLNTVVRQIAFYGFERRIHLERRKGELTADQIGKIWLEVQAESLGPAIDLPQEYAEYWTYIGHFVRSPFYVYAYAFGDCLVNSLYALYADAHPGFVAKYFDMLSAGGSKHHTELLKPFGLDASKPQFWARGLSVIEGMIDELERM